MISGRVPTIVITFSIMQDQPSATASTGSGDRCRGIRVEELVGPEQRGEIAPPVLVMLCAHMVGMSTTTGASPVTSKDTTSSSEQLAQRDPSAPLSDDEPLDLAQVEVLATGDARLGRRDERLALAAVGADHLDQAAAAVGARAERDRVVLREARCPQRVEQVDVHRIRQRRDIAGRRTARRTRAVCRRHPGRSSACPAGSSRRSGVCQPVDEHLRRALQRAEGRPPGR